MERLQVKYWKDLQRLKDVPERIRLEAEKRFLLIKEFEEAFLPVENERLGKNPRKMHALKAFCARKGIHWITLYRWQKLYSQEGLEGLIPQWGNRGWSTPEKEFIGSVKKKKRGGNQRKKISVRIEIDSLNPLRCLSQVKKVIEESSCIPEERKAFSVKVIDAISYFAKLRNVYRIHPPLSESEASQLRAYMASNHKNHSAKAMAILMMNEGRPPYEIWSEIGRHPLTLFYRWRHRFNKERLDFIEVTPDHPARVKVREERRTRVVDILHSPPETFGINRTTWTYPAIREAYQKTHGESLPSGALKRIIKQAGYSWRRARMVLTSPDPEYREKIGKMLEVLRGLRGDECFFFVDEAGPWRVKKYGGIALGHRETVRTVPVWQKAKGSVQFIVALEASGNQVTWAFTENRKAQVVLSLLTALVKKYQPYSRLYLTWDALSMHGSKEVGAWIEQNNKRSRETGEVPLVEVVPLPSKAQFLNVVESVISGLKRAVVANSDYPSVEAMQQAISEHFESRNRYYLDNPKRAGNKIWDAALFDPESLPGGLYRKM